MERNKQHLGFSLYEFKSGEFKADEYAKLVLEADKLFLEEKRLAHSRWWHEDALVHNRLTWLLQIQVILFTAYGVLIRSMPGAKDHIFNFNISENTPTTSPEIIALVSALPWLGVAFCLVISNGIKAARQAQKILGILMQMKGIELGVHPTTTRNGFLTGYVIPYIFISGWGWLWLGISGFASFVVISFFILELPEKILKYSSSLLHRLSRKN
jgi:hypothetical protein